MASNSQGITVSLNGHPSGDFDFYEVVSISIDGVQCDTVEVTPRSGLARQKFYSAADTNYGTASMVMRLPNYITATVVGGAGELQIVSPAGTIWNDRAIVQSLAWRATVGELQEYTVTFNLGARV